MVTTPTFRIISLAFAGVLSVVLSMAVQAANQYVVVFSEPASTAFPIGKVIRINDTISVSLGTTITLLGDDGSINTVRGPASLVVVEEQITATEEVTKNRSIFERISDLLIGSRSSSDSLGATRSARDKGTSNAFVNPWAISIHEHGPACVRPDRILLTRSLDLSEMPFTIIADKSKKAESFVWAKDASVFELPYPLVEQASEIIISAGLTVRFAKLNRLPADVDQTNVMSVLGWMLDNNCKAQAIIFARAIVEAPQ